MYALENGLGKPCTSIYMKKLLLLLFIVSIIPVANAQYRWDIGIAVGGANYLGEMGGKEKTRRDFIWDLKLDQTRWMVGAFARYKASRLISVNAGLNYLRLQGADRHSTNPQRVGRWLNFRNDMFELYARPEITIFQDNDLGGRGRYSTDFRLFAYVGIAAYYSNPKGQINSLGDWHELQPLATEGEDYSQIGLAIPAGIGFYFTKKRKYRFGFDMGWRTTFDDYLDDVSTIYINPDDLPNDLSREIYNQHQYAPTEVDGQAVPNEYQYGYWDPPGEESKPSENKRGDPTHNDSYLTMNVTFSYVLKGQSNFYKQRYSWIRGKRRIGRKSRAKF